MSPMHANPFDSVNIFVDTRCAKALGMHWGTVSLSTTSSSIILVTYKSYPRSMKRLFQLETDRFDPPFIPLPALYTMK